MSSRVAILALLGGCGPLWDAGPAGEQIDAGVDAGPGAVWSEGERVSVNSGGIGGLAVMMDLDGDTTAVWTQGGPAEEHLLWSTRPQAGDWSSPERIEPDEPAGATLPRLAVDVANRVHLVWQQTSGSWQSVRASVLVDGAWSAIAILSDEMGWHASQPRIAVAPGGEAIAVWQRTDNASTTFEVWSARYAPASGWTAAVRLDMTGTAMEPDVAIDGGAVATVVWREPDGVWARRSSGPGWDAVSLLRATMLSSGPQVGAGEDGDVIAVWMDDLAIRAARYRGAWAELDVVASDGGAGAATNPALAVAQNGDATVAWQDDAGHILARRYSGVVSAWEDTFTIDAAGGSLLPRVSSGAFPAVVWVHSNGGVGQVWGSGSAEGLTPATRLDPGPGSAEQPVVTGWLVGYAVAAWTVLDQGRMSVWAATYR